MQKNSAVYPGTFDPITVGHLNIIKRSLRLFNNVIIGVSANHSKNTYFSLEQRLNIVNMSLADVLTKEEFKRVKVLSYKTLLIEFLQENNVYHIVRGIRAFSDFDFELNLALANLSLEDKVETVFLPSMPEYQHISSSLIRDLIGYHSTEVEKFVSATVAKYIKSTYKS